MKDFIFKPTIFSTQTCELGEGPLWHKKRNSLFWVDILNKVLYEKEFNSKNEHYDKKWDLPYMCSALAGHGKENDKLYLLTEHSFGAFCLKTGLYAPTIKLPITDEFRTNDGGVAPDGSFWFGTMQKIPNACKGEIYSLSITGQLTKQLDHIGIPNTFCWSKNNNTFYLSDSFRQKLFSYTVKQGALQAFSEKSVIDLSESNATPDGGAMDLNNHLWNAHWDGAIVACYNTQGEMLQSVEMPVLQPTSCCFGGPENKYLFITSAKEGMTNSNLKQYPQSGMTFIVELPISGFPVNTFHLETITC